MQGISKEFYIQGNWYGISKIFLYEDIRRNVTVKRGGGKGIIEVQVCH